MPNAGLPASLRPDGVAPVLAEIPDVATAIPTVSATIADVSTKLALILAAFTKILKPLSSRVVVPNLASVLANLATVLTDLTRVAAQLAIVVTDLPLVRTQLTNFVMVQPRMKRARVRVVHILCAHEGRTSNEQGRGDRSHSEFAHRIPQRLDRALAELAALIIRRRELWDVNGQVKPATRQFLPLD